MARRCGPVRAGAACSSNGSPARSSRSWGHPLDAITRAKRRDLALFESHARRSGAERLTFDYQYDANGHPQQYYCRSDHYHYARFGIPVVFFSSGGHRDYHMVTDEPQYLEYDSLRMVTQFIHDVAWELGNRAQRPVVDKPRQDPNAQCRQ